MVWIAFVVCTAGIKPFLYILLFRLNCKLHFSEIKNRTLPRLRLCAYRSLVLWIFKDLERKERRLIPSCLVEEEVFAEWEFVGFVYGDEYM